MRSVKTDFYSLHSLSFYHKYVYDMFDILIFIFNLLLTGGASVSVTK